jgi:hypothetical protein
MTLQDWFAGKALQGVMATAHESFYKANPEITAKVVLVDSDEP